jgi:tetratricopeptide (TPR) repeat protein
MSLRAKLYRILPAFFVAASSLLPAQTGQTGLGEAALQDNYISAQRFQKEGDLDKAADRYRMFLSVALGELGVARADAGQYTKATVSFEQALALVPDSQQLRLSCMKAALHHDDDARAETLARSFLKDYPTSHNLAQAHRVLGLALLGVNRDQDAKKELEQAVALDPTFANGYDLAVACLDLDDETCATQLFTELQASFGDTAAIHMAFGRAYGNSDFAPRAVAEFQKAIALAPQMPGVHYSLAAALLATNEDDKTKLLVEAELKKELSISPKDFLTYAALGKLAVASHRYDEADQYLKEAIALNPQSPDAFLYLGQMYFDTDRLTDAEPALRKAIQLTTDEARNHYQIQKAHFLLGRILAQSHRSDEAHREMQIAREFANKGLSQDKNKLSGLLQDNSQAAEASPDTIQATAPQPDTLDPAAIRNLERLEKLLAPPIADSFNNLGVIAATHQDFRGAVGYFQLAGNWNPSLDELDYNMGRAAFSASMFSDAIAPLSRYLRTHPDVSGVRTALAMSQFMVDDYSGALTTLQPASQDVLSLPQMQFIYAQSLVKTGEITLGKERLQQLEASHPEIPDIHRSLGEVYAMQGDPRKAAFELQSALQLNSKDAQAQYDLGKVAIESGNATAAIRPLEIAVQLMPSNPEYHRELASAYKAAWRPAEAEKELQVYETLSAPKTGDNSAKSQVP